MSHSHSSWSDLPPFTFPQRLSSLLLPSHSDEQSLDPRAERSGRLATQTPLTNHEPYTIVEISSTEVTPIHLPSKLTSFCSAMNSGEDATNTLVCSEVDKRLSIGRVASPLLCRREKQVQSLQEFITPLEAHPTFEARGDLSQKTHTNGNRAETQETHGRQRTRDTNRK